MISGHSDGCIGHYELELGIAFFEVLVSVLYSISLVYIHLIAFKLMLRDIFLP